MDRSSEANSSYRLLERRMPNQRSVGKPGHFYLVLDDWSWGYTIRRIDLLFGDPAQKLIPVGEQRDTICTAMHRLPAPVFRFQGRRREPKSILGVIDNMVLAMPPFYGLNIPGPHGCTVVDMHAQTFIRGPMCPDLVDPICIPVGRRLFVLDVSSCWMLFQADDDSHYCHFVWEWIKLPKPVFQSEHVTSYAVHPDERTIFVSKFSGAPVTFSINIVNLDTEEPVSSEWKAHGPWRLPFTGRGYFDPELDAWVGLSAQMDTIGHICACDVVSTSSDTSQCPAMKVSKEKLLSEVSAERHIGATLIYMGGESKYCLLEYIQAGLDDQPTYSDETNEYSVGEDYETDCDELNEYSSIEVNEEQDQKCFLRLTTFSLKYDKNGDLTTGDSGRVCCYSMPYEVDDSVLKCPVAFWM